MNLFRIFFGVLGGLSILWFALLVLSSAGVLDAATLDVDCKVMTPPPGQPGAGSSEPWFNVSPQTPAVNGNIPVGTSPIPGVDATGLIVFEDISASDCCEDLALKIMFRGAPSGTIGAGNSWEVRVLDVSGNTLFTLDEANPEVGVALGNDGLGGTIDLGEDFSCGDGFLFNFQFREVRPNGTFGPWENVEYENDPGGVSVAARVYCTNDPC